MKKIFLLGIIVIALNSCNIGSNTTNTQTENTTPHWVIEHSKNKQENSSSENTENTTERSNPSLQALLDLCKKMWKENCQNAKKTFSWQTEDAKTIEIDGYTFIEKKYMWEASSLPEILFKDWEMSTPNMADGPAMFHYGYTKNNIVCTIDTKSNAENVVDETQWYHIEISCGTRENTEEELWVEIENLELEAHSEDPTWSIVINKDMLVYDSPKNYPERGKEFEVKTYIKDGKIITFRWHNEADTISGTFQKQTCVSNGKDHTFLVQWEINGEKLSACGDEFTVEYNPDYEETSDTQAWDQEIEELMKEFAKSIFMKESDVTPGSFNWHTGTQEETIQGFILKNTNYSDSDIGYEGTLFESWDMDENNIWDAWEESFVWYTKDDIVCKATTKINATQEQILKDGDPSLYGMTLTIACGKYTAEK